MMLITLYFGDFVTVVYELGMLKQYSPPKNNHVWDVICVLRCLIYKWIDYNTWLNRKHHRHMYIDL